ncbi:MAG TPA: PP2C family protein-serine/threonine phosphatase [Actinocrinis sp.]|nr:PP2C family protein-serine/threonine phosphatase [Actinocrinis sp.]
MTTELEGARLDGAGTWDVLEESPFPVIVTDAAGLVVDASASALAALPGLRRAASLGDCAPAWLAVADRAGVASAAGEVGDGYLRAQATGWAGGRRAWWLTDETRYETTRLALARERDRTDFLVEASNQLLSSLNVDKCTATTAVLAARYLADSSIVVAPTAGRRLPITRATAEGVVTRETVSRDPGEVPGLSEALQGFPPVPSRWIDPASAPDWLIPRGQSEIGSLMVTPLPGNGVAAGALVLLRRPGREQFTEDEERFARLFAARAGAALGAARLFQEQASVARTLVQELLPPRLGRMDGVEFAAAYRPSRDDHRIGGDFYDFHPANDLDPRALIVLGDVCGKGIEAAVLTGKIRTSLHTLRTVQSDHVAVLGLLNSALLSSAHTRFATMVLASVRAEGGQVELTLTCAGHPAPMIVRADGTVHPAPAHGTLIGALADVRFTSCSVTLAPGEACLLYSDGITEVRGGPLGTEMFGVERLTATLAECAGLPAEAIVERVQMLAIEWAGRAPHDDMALVAICAPLDQAISADADASADAGRGIGSGGWFAAMPGGRQETG